MPIDLRQPFRGTDAVAAGVVTPKILRGPRFRRLFSGIYIRADVEVTFEVRSRAAYLLLDGSGVLGGFSAAELLGASCGPLDAPAEVVVVFGGVRTRPGLLVRHDELAPDEVTHVAGWAVTSPLRTAYDLARRLPLVEAVVALDALAFAQQIVPADLQGYERCDRSERRLNAPRRALRRHLGWIIVVLIVPRCGFSPSGGRSSAFRSDQRSPV